METFAQPEPLTDAELNRLGDFVEACKDAKAMNVERSRTGGSPLHIIASQRERLTQETIARNEKASES